MNFLTNAFFFAFLVFLIPDINCTNVEPNERKDPHTFQVTIASKTFTFKLSPRKRDVFSKVPVWSLNSQGISFKAIMGEDDLICEDPKSLATFIPVRDCLYVSGCNATYFTGVFGKGVKQQFLSIEKKHRKLLRELKKYIHESNQCPFDGNIKINVTVQEVEQESGIVDYRELPLAKISNNRPKRSMESKTWRKLILQVLLVVDYALYKKLFTNYEYIVQYMDVFWSAVDLKYHDIYGPKIYLNVSGIIVVEEQNVLNYTDKFKFEDYENTLDMDQALENCEEIKLFFNSTNITDHNVIVTLSGLNGYSDYSRCYGMTYRKSVCSPVGNGIIVTDNGKFFGINNVVHEIGHSLGLRHDGYDGEDSEIDYKRCGKSAQGSGIHSVMHPENTGGDDRFAWSECSLQYFHSLQRDESVSCIGR